MSLRSSLERTRTKGRAVAERRRREEERAKMITRCGTRKRLRIAAANADYCNGESETKSSGGWKKKMQEGVSFYFVFVFSRMDKIGRFSGF